MMKNSKRTIRKSSIACLALLVLPFLLPAQTELLPPDGFMEDWVKLKKSLRFERDGLFGYINGAAELFLEFGFEELLVQNYGHGADEIGIEIYRMESSNAALGLYLMKCGREEPLGGLPFRHTGDRFQLIITKSHYFLLVNNFKGREVLVPVMIEMARQTLEKIQDTGSSQLLSLLPERDRIAGSERIFRGPYSLEPIYSFGEGDILSLKGRIFGVAANYKGQREKALTRIIIPYTDDGQASDACNSLLLRLDTSIQVINRSANKFSFKDSLGRIGSVIVDGNILEIQIDPPDHPN